VREVYSILACFPFSSETKRMGIIVRHIESGRIIFFLKGAETVMKNKLKVYQRLTVDEQVDNLAQKGLRTLVISEKLIQEEEFEAWFDRYREAQADLNERERKIREVVEELEVDMELLGVTGVEGKVRRFSIDKLQDEVALTIEKLRTAGLKIWMLTGDKIETATCIAISACIKHKKHKLFFMRDMESMAEVEELLGEFERKTETVLIIDGQTIELILKDKKLEERFFKSSTLVSFESYIFYRPLPFVCAGAAQRKKQS